MYIAELPTTKQNEIKREHVVALALMRILKMLKHGSQKMYLID